jgi:NDP-sugar pyrophosphorylase family protein
VKAVVLCAGLGTRLGDLTREIPKAMLPICGRPLLHYMVRYLRENGYRHIAINLHYEPQVITDYFGDGSDFGVDLHYSHESSLLGTAGAVKKLEPYLSDVDDFLVVYGDLLIDQDLQKMRDFHSAVDADATLLLHRRTNSNSVVSMGADYRITTFRERQTRTCMQIGSDPWVNSGLQILNRGVLGAITAGTTSDLPKDVYQERLTSERLFGFPLTGYRCAIDSQSRYSEAMAAVREKRYRYWQDEPGGEQ